MSDPTPSSDGPQPGQIGPCQTWNHQSKGRIHGVEVRGDETWMHVRLVGDHRMRWLSPGRARSGEVTPDGEVVTLRRSFMTLVPDDVPVPPAPSSDTPSGERATCERFTCFGLVRCSLPADHFGPHVSTDGLRFTAEDPLAPLDPDPSGEPAILTPRQQAIEAILIRHQDHAFSFVARRIDALFTAPTPVPEASERPDTEALRYMAKVTAGRVNNRVDWAKALNEAADWIDARPAPSSSPVGGRGVDVTALPEWAALRELVADEMAAAPGHDHIAAMDAIADAAEALFAAADRGEPTDG